MGLRREAKQLVIIRNHPVSMSKKKRRNPAHKPLSVAPITIHGVTVKVPAEIALSPSALTLEASTTAERIMREAQRRREHAPKAEAPPSISTIEEQWLKTAANIVTNAWRAKVKMVDADTNEPTEPMKRVYRHVEAIFDALKQIGVEHIDVIGQPYDSGMALKVVTFEPTPGLSREEIKETIKPSVTWQGRLIQMGEVIVGTPPKPLS
jgi:hypothetical protein